MRFLIFFLLAMPQIALAEEPNQCLTKAASLADNRNIHLLYSSQKDKTVIVSHPHVTFAVICNENDLALVARSRLFPPSPHFTQMSANLMNQMLPKIHDDMQQRLQACQDFVLASFKDAEMFASPDALPLEQEMSCGVVKVSGANSFEFALRDKRPLVQSSPLR